MDNIECSYYFYKNHNIVISNIINTSLFNDLNLPVGSCQSAEAIFE